MLLTSSSWLDQYSARDFVVTAFLSVFRHPPWSTLLGISRYQLSVTAVHAGFYALQEITAILDPQLARHKTGRDIMDKLESYSRKAPTPCDGLKLEIQPNPMAPVKSIRWRRASVAESGADLNNPEAEDVPYVLLYFTVRAVLHCNLCAQPQSPQKFTACVASCAFSFLGMQSGHISLQSIELMYSS